jgi:hypothetical protein
MAEAKLRSQAGDALLIVDVQSGLHLGGALPMPEGDAVMPILDEWIKAAELTVVRSMPRVTGMRRGTLVSQKKAGYGRRIACKVLQKRYSNGVAPARYH